MPIEFQIEANPKNALAAMDQLRAAATDMSRGVEGAGDRLQGVLDRASKLVLSMNDRQRSSLETLTRSIEKQAAAYGKTGIEKLIAQRDQYIRRLGDEENLVKRVTAAYDKMIRAEEGSGANRFKEIGESIKQYIETPLQSAQATAAGFLEKMGPAGAAISGMAVGAAALGTALYEIATRFAESSEAIVNLSAASGMEVNALDRLGAMAKLTGSDVGTLSRAGTAMAQTLDEGGAKAAIMMSALQRLNVSVYDLAGAQRQEGDILVDVLQQLSLVTNQHDRLALAAETLGPRVSRSIQPLISDYDELRKTVEQYGFGQQRALIEQGDMAARKIHELGIAVDEGTRIFGVGAVTIAEWGAKIGILAMKVQPLYQVMLKLKELGGGQADEDPVGRQLRRDIEALAAKGAGPGFDAEQGAERTIANLTRKIDTDDSFLKTIKRQAEEAAAAIKKSIEALRELAGAAGKGQDLFPETSKALSQVLRLKGADVSPGFQFYESVRTREMEKNARELADLRTKADEKVGSGGAGPSGDAISALARTAGEGALKDFRTELQGQGTVMKAALGYQEEIIRLQNGPQGELDTVRQIYELRRAGAKDQYEQQVLAIDYLKDQARIVDEQMKKQQEAATKLRNQQLESISGPATGLFGTLFTNPRKFGLQLQSTLKDSMLKPVEEGLGGLAARTLQPLVYGSDGHSGIAGMFRGVFGSQKESNPLVPLAQETNWRLAAIASLLAAGTGMMAGMPSGGVPGLTVQGAGMPFSITGGGSGTASIPSGFGLSIGGFGGGGMPSPSIVSGGSTGEGGFTPFSLAGPGGTPGFAPGRILGGGGGGAQGFGSGLGSSISSLARGFGIGTSALRIGPTSGGGTITGADGLPLNLGGGQPGMTIPTEGTTFGSVMRSPAVGAAGMMLATNGLAGSHMGTWAGVGEGTAGGALVGAQYGPFGAAVGAAVGFGIGIGEKIAGVETPENQAKRLARQVYNISIDNQMASQIVALSKEKYGNTMSIAIRSPEVRQMLGLYAAGTGQASKFPQSASTPHGASLVESGGSLYQQATYQYGNAYTMQSNLPVMGPSGGTYPNPSGPTYVSLSIGSQDAAGFMTGSYVTPSFVQSQFASAQTGSNGRVTNSASMQGQPALIVA